MKPKIFDKSSAKILNMTKKLKEVSVYCGDMTGASGVTNETSISCVVLFVVRYDLNF
jgi:hypothetical protein